MKNLIYVFLVLTVSCAKYEAPIQDIQSELQGEWNVDRLVLVDHNENIVGHEDQPGMFFNFEGNKMCTDSLRLIECTRFDVDLERQVLVLQETGRELEVYNLNANTVELAGPYSPEETQRIIFYLRKIN